MSTAHSRIVQADSFHPKILVSFPPSYLAALPAEECKPVVLVRLPPALFIDPNTFPSTSSQSFSSSISSAKVISLRHLGSDHPSLSSHDFTRVELEQGVGYSDPKGEQRAKEASQDGSGAATSRYNTPRGKEVKRLGQGQFVVASRGSVHTRYQDANADASRPLAKEYRAALLTLDKQRNIDAEDDDHVNSEEVEYDDLTGFRIGKEAVTLSLEIQLHARYVEPIKTDGTLGEMWKAGNYQDVLLDKPEVLWMCRAVHYVLDSDLYDYIDASDLLPIPHSHLSLQLPSEYNFHRLRLDAQDTPFVLNLPAGDVSIGPYIHLATFISLLLSAIWVIIKVHSSLAALQRSQSIFSEKSSVKEKTSTCSISG